VQIQVDCRRPRSSAAFHRLALDILVSIYNSHGLSPSLLKRRISLSFLPPPNRWLSKEPATSKPVPLCGQVPKNNELTNGWKVNVVPAQKDGTKNKDCINMQLGSRVLFKKKSHTTSHSVFGHRAREFKCITQKKNESKTSVLEATHARGYEPTYKGTCEHVRIVWFSSAELYLHVFLHVHLNVFLLCPCDILISVNPLSSSPWKRIYILYIYIYIYIKSVNSARQLWDPNLFSDIIIDKYFSLDQSDKLRDRRCYADSQTAN